MFKPSFQNLVLVLVLLLFLAIVGFGFTRLRLQAEEGQRVLQPEELIEKPENDKEVSVEIPEDTIISPEQVCAKTDLSIFSEQRLSFDQDQEAETLIVCGEMIASYETLGGYRMYVLDDRIANGRVLWTRVAGRGVDERVLGFRRVSSPEVVDVEDDGIDEIYWTGSTHGGTCTVAIAYKLLYSPTYGELFYRVDSTRADSRCVGITGPPEFSANLETDQYTVFKDYLKSRK